MHIDPSLTHLNGLRGLNLTRPILEWINFTWHVTDPNILRVGYMGQMLVKFESGLEVKSNLANFDY